MSEDNTVRLIAAFADACVRSGLELQKISSSSYFMAMDVIDRLEPGPRIKAKYSAAEKGIGGEELEDARVVNDWPKHGRPERMR